MVKKEKNKGLKILEKALHDFWMDHGRILSINGKHTEVVITPRFLVGKHVNPEVARRLISVHLSQATPEDIASERIIISPEKIVIKSKNGKTVVEITDQNLISRIIGEVKGRLSGQGLPFLS